MAHAPSPSSGGGCCSSRPLASVPAASRVAEFPGNPEVAFQGTPRGHQQHARRLNLRHTGFRGALLAGSNEPIARRTPTRPSHHTATGTRPTDHPPIPGEPLTVHREPERTSPSQTSILQEISNQATVRRYSPGRSLLSNIFHQSTGESPSKSEFAIFDDENASPADSHAVVSGLHMPRMRNPIEAGQERHFNLRGMRVSKSRRYSRPVARSPSSESKKYIEHLESELTSANSKLEALTSPSTSPAQSNRTRILSRQAHNLRQELADWEARFEKRVNEQVSERSRIEAGLKVKIQKLTDELEERDVRLLDLQEEARTLRDRLAASEALEANLSRRIDVLTELLAHLPVHSNQAKNSPTVPGSSKKRSSRPTSMILPKLATSIVSPVRREFQTPTRLTRRETGTLSPGASGLDSQLVSPTQGYQGVDRFRVVDQVSANESGPVVGSAEADCDHALSETSRLDSDYSLIQSAPSSRPTSLMSDSSLWSAWGLPAASEQPSKPELKSRRMRRFMAGSTTLKPLLLPATTSLPGEAQSAPILDWSTLREAASKSLDEYRIDNFQAGNAITESDKESTNDRLRNGSVGGRIAPSVPHPNRHEMEDPQEPDGNLSMLARTHTISSPLQILPELGSMASSPRPICVSPADPYTPMKPLDYFESDSKYSYSSGRTIRIQTPDTNLDTVLLGDVGSLASPSPLMGHSFTLDPSPYASQTSPKFSRALSSNIVRHAVSGDSLCARFLERIRQLLMSLKRETLVNLKTMLVRCWTRGSSGLGAFGWWVFGLADDTPPRFPGPPSSSTSESVAPVQLCQTPSRIPQSPSAMSGPLRDNGVFGRSWPHVLSFNVALQTPPPDYQQTKGLCPACVEPPLRRNLRLWCKFSLAIALAVGVAIINGPDALMHREDQARAHDVSARLDSIGMQRQGCSLRNNTQNGTC